MKKIPKMKDDTMPYQMRVTYYGDESGKRVNKDFEKKLFMALEKIGYKPTGGSGFDFTRNCRDISFVLTTVFRCPVCSSQNHKWCGINPPKPA